MLEEDFLYLIIISKMFLSNKVNNSTKTIYRLLKRDLLEDYVFLEKSGRVYLILEPPNRPTLANKIRENIQYRRNNIIMRCK